MENLLAFYQGCPLLLGRRPGVFGVDKHNWAWILAHYWDKFLIFIVAFAVLTFTKINRRSLS